ncbi:hypothetical protein HDU76_006961 [Blyttiomyces sp. JEL0837]|nr:hypothetical protein HDU76_006961 [Blyttiomyces sp. JEL0837]
MIGNTDLTETTSIRRDWKAFISNKAEVTCDDDPVTGIFPLLKDPNTPPPVKRTLIQKHLPNIVYSDQPYALLKCHLIPLLQMDDVDWYLDEIGTVVKNVLVKVAWDDAENADVAQFLRNVLDVVWARIFVNGEVVDEEKMIKKFGSYDAVTSFGYGMVPVIIGSKPLIAFYKQNPSLFTTEIVNRWSPLTSHFTIKGSIESVFKELNAGSPTLSKDSQEFSESFPKLKPWTEVRDLFDSFIKPSLTAAFDPTASPAIRRASMNKTYKTYNDHNPESKNAHKQIVTELTGLGARLVTEDGAKYMADVSMMMALVVCSKLEKGKIGPDEVTWCGDISDAIAKRVRVKDYSFILTPSGYSMVTVLLMKVKDVDPVRFNNLCLNWFDCIDDRMDDTFAQFLLMPHIYVNMDDGILLDRLMNLYLNNKEVSKRARGILVHALSTFAVKPGSIKYVKEFLGSEQQSMITNFCSAIDVSPSHADALLKEIPTLLLDSFIDAIDNADGANPALAASNETQISQIMNAVAKSDDDEIIDGVLSRLFDRVAKLMVSDDNLVKASAISLVLPLNHLSKEKPDLMKKYRPAIDSLLQDSKTTNEVKDQLKVVVNELDGMTIEHLGSMFSTTMKSLGIDPNDPFYDAVQALEGAEVKVFDVMLSYNWNHKATVIRIRDSLIKRNLSVWMDLDQMSGNVYAKMAEAVLGSKIVIPCLTLAYEASGNCKRELGFAADNTRSGKKIVPVRLENAAFTWSALITAGLLYTYIGDDELKDEGKWEAAMDGLEREVRAALEGVESIKAPIVAPGVVQKKEETGEKKEGTGEVVGKTVEKSGVAGSQSAVPSTVIGSVVAATAGVAMVSAEVVTALDSRVQAVEDFTRKLGETVEASKNDVMVRLNRVEELLVSLTSNKGKPVGDSKGVGSVVEGKTVDVNSLNERIGRLESAVEVQARTIEMQKRTIDSLMTFMGVRVREQN